MLFIRLLRNKKVITSFYSVHLCTTFTCIVNTESMHLSCIERENRDRNERIEIRDQRAQRGEIIWSNTEKVPGKIFKYLWKCFVFKSPLVEENLAIFLNICICEGLLSFLVTGYIFFGYSVSISTIPYFFLSFRELQRYYNISVKTEIYF